MRLSYAPGVAARQSIHPDGCKSAITVGAIELTWVGAIFLTFVGAIFLTFVGAISLTFVGANLRCTDQSQARTDTNQARTDGVGQLAPTLMG